MAMFAAVAVCILSLYLCFKSSGITPFSSCISVNILVVSAVFSVLAEIIFKLLGLTVINKLSNSIYMEKDLLDNEKIEIRYNC